MTYFIASSSSLPDSHALRRTASHEIDSSTPEILSFPVLGGRPSVDLAPDELLLKLALVVALGAMPSNTLELSGERSSGSTATRFGVAIDGSRGARSFGLGAVPWKDISSSWHDSGLPPVVLALEAGCCPDPPDAAEPNRPLHVLQHYERPDRGPHRLGQRPHHIDRRPTDHPTRPGR